MTITVTIDEAAAKFKELVRLLGPGDEVTVTELGLPVARLGYPFLEVPPPPRPAPGALRGRILYMAEDFDAPLEDMKEYME